ncbi:MAG TPA: DUF4126 domain-containing protein [Phycisphaerales bacterium]|nr:DUF4126 domain-containing protein [Phycisphaerales bacterium]
MPTSIDWSVILALVSGIGLAAAAGFRVFVPLLLLAVAARAGVVPLAPSFAWLSSDAALITLGSACALEIGAYYIPWLDHALDVIAAPAAVVAGSIAVAAPLAGFDPWLAWAVGIVAGGGAAGLVQGATILARGVSLIATGGLGNPIVATAENALAILVAAMAILVPVLGVLAVGVALFIIIRRVRRAKTRRQREPASLAVAA